MEPQGDRFEVEGRWYETMIASCSLRDGVGLCLMVTDARTGREVVDICQVHSSKKCFIEMEADQVPVAVMQRAMEIFEERVRLK